MVSAVADRTRALPARQVDAVVDATRVVGALIANTLAQIEPPVTMPQWRVLVLASDGGCQVSAIAEDLNIHPSNSTRIVDRLASAGLLERHRGTVDRRKVLVTLTPAGRDLYEKAMRLRKVRIEQAMGQMSVAERKQLVDALTLFSDRLRAGAGPSPEGTGPARSSTDA